MANRLAREQSLYLRQHADNPVDWYRWGPEALERAREEERPILLSIGYSACHWCHVMERESFEDPDTAAVMNEAFVCVKVDREERPDVDGIYMRAVQALTGRGGWPLTVFLTPDARPYYGGTYFPPRAAPRDAFVSPGPVGHPRGVGPTTGPGRGRRGEDREPSSKVHARAGRRADGAGAGSGGHLPRVEGGGRAPGTVRPDVRGVWSGAEVPPASSPGLSSRGLRVLGPEAGPRRGRAHASADGAGRDPRPPGRRVPSVLGGPAVARSPLREDALRQRAPRRNLPSGLPAERRPRPPGDLQSRRGGSPGELPRPRRCVLRRAGRGFGGRGGALLPMGTRGGGRRARRPRRVVSSKGATTSPRQGTSRGGTSYTCLTTSMPSRGTKA